MHSHIIINKRIYKNFKDEVILLNPRLFTEEYFYDLKQYTPPFALKGLEEFIDYIDEITIYSTTTFLDFINILLVLSFLKEKKFMKKICIQYYLISTKKMMESVISKMEVHYQDFFNVDQLLEEIKNHQLISLQQFILPGSRNYIQFYNMLFDKEKWLMNLEEMINEYDEDINVIALNLAEKYSNMGLNQQFYIDYLSKYL